MKKSLVAILGGGMYVLGRKYGSGTIYNALVQLSDAYAFDLDLLVRDSSRLEDSDLQANIHSIGDVESDATLLEDYLKKQKPKALIIALPDSLHFKAVKSSILSGVPCLVVKPFVEEVHQAQELSELSDSTGLGVFVEFHKRFDTQNRWLRHQIRSRQAGQISSIDVNYDQKILIPTEVFRDWAERTNIFQYLGVHYVDLIWWLTGAVPESLTAVSVGSILRDMHNINVDDRIIVNIKWRLGEYTFGSCLNIGWVSRNETPAMSDQRMWIKASEMTIELDQMNRGVRVADKLGYRYDNPYFSCFIDGDSGPEYFGYAVDSIRAFLDFCYEARRITGLCDAREATVSVAVNDAVRQSLAGNGQQTTVDLDGVLENE